jgi:hypothetical protein
MYVYFLYSWSWNKSKLAPGFLSCSLSNVMYKVGYDVVCFCVIVNFLQTLSIFL